MSGSASAAASHEADQHWPCSPAALDEARRFIKDAAKGERTVLAPDRDADGLCAGAIVRLTLRALGASVLPVVFMAKGSNIHSPEASQQLLAERPSALIVLDQGSRPGPPLLPASTAPVLIMDHHQSLEFPEGAQVVSSFGHEPVATSSLLAYITCLPLLQGLTNDSERQALILRAEWLAIVGTFGDLGNSVKWEPPLPDLNAATRRWTRKTLGQVVSLLNAPRRTAECDPLPAWEALEAAAEPADIAAGRLPQARQLQDCREAVNAEVARCARVPPKFTPDGRIALVTLASGAQIHPVIATRWAGTLKGKSLVAVMVANTGYLPDRVNFAMRIPKSAKLRPDSGNIDLITLLRELAATGGAEFVEGLGQDYARGHAQATGGSVSAEAFARLKELMGFGGSGGTGNGGGKPGQMQKPQQSSKAAADEAISGKKRKTLEDFGFHNLT